MSLKKPRILLVGWDAADWKVARPLMAAGEMPNLTKLVAEGASGNLATLQPPLSPMLWTSIATGKRPSKHGIHGFSEPTPDGSAVRPITTLGRKTKAIWNILHQSGFRTSIVGWWPSYPVEPVRGVMVSNSYTHAGDGPEPAQLPRYAVHPPDWVDRLAELRITPMELPAEALGLFAPQHSRVDQVKDKRLHMLGRMVAETMTLHAAATEVLEFAEWDFAAVYYDAIDHFSHGFMGFHPPRQTRISEKDFEIFGPVVANAYRYHDLMLGRLIELAGPDTTVIVMSDHGFHAELDRPAHIPAEAAGPAVEHRDFGLFAMRGQGIKAGETIYGASLLDITPTLLRLFNLPVGEDMDGKVLITALESPGQIAPIASWDLVPGDSASHPPDAQFDPVASAEAMRQLIDLGYVTPPGNDAAQNVRETVVELKYNLARSLDDAGELNESIPLYTQLCTEDPGDHRFAERLINALIHMGSYSQARDALDNFDSKSEEAAPASAAELARRRSEKTDVDLDIRDMREIAERRSFAERATGFPGIRKLLRLRLNLAEGRKDEALACLGELEKLYAEHDRPPALRMAESYLVLNESEKASLWLHRALKDDPENWQALSLLARVHLRAQAQARRLMQPPLRWRWFITSPLCITSWVVFCFCGGITRMLNRPCVWPFRKCLGWSSRENFLFGFMSGNSIGPTTLRDTERS